MDGGYTSSCYITYMKQSSICRPFSHHSHSPLSFIPDGHVVVKISVYWNDQMRWRWSVCPLDLNLFACFPHFRFSFRARIRLIWTANQRDFSHRWAPPRFNMLNRLKSLRHGQTRADCEVHIAKTWPADAHRQPETVRRLSAWCVRAIRRVGE